MDSPSAIGLLVCAVLGSWLAATVVAQARSTAAAAWIRGLDPVSLLPSWSFFAPNPGTRDHHLVYRARLGGSSLSRWVELPLAGRRKPWHALWNPHMRQDKVLSDAVGILTRLQGSMRATGFKTTLPYLVLLNHIGGVASSMAEAVQFAILESHAYAAVEPRAVFLSEFHRLEREGHHVRAHR